MSVQRNQKMAKHTIDRSEFPLENHRQYTSDGRIATHVHPGAGHVVVNEQTGEAFPSPDYQGAGVQPANTWLPHVTPDPEGGAGLIPPGKLINFTTPVVVYTFSLTEQDSVKLVISSPMTSPPASIDIDLQLFTFSSLLAHNYRYQQVMQYKAMIDDPTGYRDYLSLQEVSSWILFQPITVLLEAVPTTGVNLDGLPLWDYIPSAQKAKIIAEWDAYWTDNPPDPLDYGREEYQEPVPGKSEWRYSLHKYHKILYRGITFNSQSDPVVDQYIHLLRDYITAPVWPSTNSICIETDSIIDGARYMAKGDINFAFKDFGLPANNLLTADTCPFSEGGATTAYDQEHDETVTIADRQWTVKITPFGLKWTVVDTAKSWTRSCYWIFDGWVISHVYDGQTLRKAFTMPDPGLSDGDTYAALQAQDYTETRSASSATRKWEDQGDTTSYNFFDEHWADETNSICIKLALSPLGTGYIAPFTFETIIS